MEVYWNLSLSTYSPSHHWIFIQSLRHHSVIVRWDIYDLQNKMDLYFHSAPRACSDDQWRHVNTLRKWQRNNSHSFKMKIFSHSDTIWYFKFNTNGQQPTRDAKPSTFIKSFCLVLVSKSHDLVQIISHHAVSLIWLCQVINVHYIVSRWSNWNCNDSYYHTQNWTLLLWNFMFSCRATQVGHFMAKWKERRNERG